jgi:hypothetical protein
MSMQCFLLPSGEGGPQGRMRVFLPPREDGRNGRMRLFPFSPREKSLPRTRSGVARRAG